MSTKGNPLGLTNDPQLINFHKKRMRPKSLSEMGIEKCKHPIQYYVKDIVYGTKLIYKTNLDGSIKTINPKAWNFKEETTCGLCGANTIDFKEWKGGANYSIPHQMIRSLLTKEWWDDRLFES